MKLYGIEIATSGMSLFTNIKACGRDFTLMPPAGVGRQSWVLKKLSSGIPISVYRCKEYPKALCRALEEITKFIEKENAAPCPKQD